MTPSHHPRGPAPRPSRASTGPPLRNWLSGGLVLAISLAPPGAALGGEECADQVQETFDDYFIPVTAAQAAQTFRVGMSGELVAVELYLRPVGNPVGTVPVEIRDEESSHPGDAVLATGTIDAEAVVEEGFVRVDLTPLDVVPNEVVAIVVGAFDPSPAGDQLDWMASRVNPYFLGNALIRSGVDHWGVLYDPGEDSLIDFAFRTWVECPTPVSRRSWGSIKAGF